MTASSSGAVFFLGTRAHYQVLQPPESSYDVENGNASTETIYEEPSVHAWKDQGVDSSGDYGESNWSYCDNEAVTEDKDQIELEPSAGVKRRVKRHSSETELCERDAQMKPALLNYLDSNTPKSKPSRRVSILTFLGRLARRKRHLHTDQVHYLQHLESALTSCTYRESCRCLECQSRYFDCDDSEYSSDDESDYAQYAPRYAAPAHPPPQDEGSDSDDDDEVFIDKLPEDNTSTDLLIEGREQPATLMSVSSDEAAGAEEDALEIEVAAGTPVLLNYLLTHPITCNIM